MSRDCDIAPRHTARRSDTYTCVLLDGLKDPLGREQEVEEAAQAVSAVLPLHHAEELPQHSRRAGTERGVERRQGALDAAVQRLRVLQGKTELNMRTGGHSGHDSH